MVKSLLALLLLLGPALSFAQAQAQAPAQPQLLPFEQALHEMIASNLNFQVQNTKLAGAEAQVGAARGAFTPQLYLQGQQQSAGGNNLSNPAADDNGNAQVYSVNAKWNIFRSGADWAGLRAANLNLDFNRFQVDDAYLQAEDKSARALLDLTEKVRIAEAYHRSFESVNHFLEIAHARFTKSLLSREDADRVALDAANAEARWADAEIQANDARATVEALLGHARVQSDWPWEAKLSFAHAEPLLGEQARELALANRPDLLAAKSGMESEEARSRFFYRSMLPTVDLTYSLGDTHIQGHIISGWSSLATLTIPLWSGLHDYSAYKVQVAAKYAAEFRWRQLQRDAQSSVAAAQANFRLSVQQYHARVLNLNIARHLLEQDGARFRVGRAGADELNLDLSRVTAAEILAIQGIRQAHVTYMVLSHVVGKSAL